MDMGQLSELRSVKPSRANDSIYMGKVPYREPIGGLLLLVMCIRPDIAAAVEILERRVADPRNIDWQAAKRILRYQKGTASLELKFPAYGDIILSVYEYADYATRADRKSVSWCLSMLRGNAVIDWICQKQKTVALLTAEAEYIAQS
jgi:hypothetical protein